MSSNPSKQAPKMCKSPKAANFQQQSKPEKIILNEYESLNTNCTTVGSNNLHLVKKPQLMTNMSPAYSNPSPSYPHSPYSSPAGLKSPSPQHMKPPTPQPTSFPVMQIIHNNHPLLARPIQTSQPQSIIKLKPHLNILPKPSASPQPSPKPSVSPQIVIPTNQQATIMPTAQPLLLNQMPVLTTPSVQFILRPQTAKIPAQMQTATATPQGLILQPSNQPLLHIQPPRSQPLVRVLTNGVQLAPPTTTYVTQLTHPPQNNSNIVQSPVMQTQPSPPKKKPKKKIKQKLDLANIMKLSGIGDEDDIQFESDTSQSESEPTSVHSQPNTPQPQQQQNVIHPQHNLIQSQQNIVQTQANILQSTDTKKIGNIQISAVSQPTINAAATPLVQVLNQSFQSIPTSQAPTAQASIPFNPFITPNFTINNGLMVQRSGGFKLTLGEDGRLILQHDPTLNQDLQSQLLLQSIFGLNGLVLQPSIDQQVHSQTVQTIQQQSVQTIQQQTVQSQTIQTVQQQTVQPHSLQAIQPQIQTVQPQTMQQTVQQTIQHQTVQSQPLPAAQPMQIVQPQPIQNLNQSIQSQTVHSIQSQVQPTLHSIQSQIQSLLQSQLHSQNIQSQSQSLPIQTMQSQSIQSVQSQPLIVHSQPMQITHTVQSQPLQSIQTQCSQALPQTMQSQSIQTVQPQPIHSQHSVQTQVVNTQSQPIQSQPVLKVQPFQKSQPPVQTVHPQPAVATVAQTINHHPIQSQNSSGEHQSQNAPPTSYVVNLTPEQLEQLKRNGQLTVNGQTIFMQRPNATNKPHHEVNASPDSKAKLSPKIKPDKKKVTKITSLKDNGNIKSVEKTLNNIKEPTTKSSLVSALQTPPKHVTQNHVLQVQPPQPIQPIVQKPTSQPSALVQPSVQTTTTTQTPQPKIQAQPLKTQAHANILPAHANILPAHANILPAQAQSTPNNVPPVEPSIPNQDVERLLGQIIEESGANVVPPTSNVINSQNHSQSMTQRVHTIQLTPQKQQHLKSIQLQIQTLSARLTPGDTEMHNALKLLFQEQQKILATGKLLPPDKVYYHNNQLTIVNPSSLAPIQSKSESSSTGPIVVRTTSNDTPSSHQIATTQTAKVSVPECNVSISQSNITTQPLQNVQNVGPRLTTPISTSQSSLAQPQPSQQHRFLPSFTKAQLIEQQLNTDQNGAIKPDVYTPFRDKADACKRLIRYHCFDQHVLSQKDLNKADEIFELTAKHFIDKFSKMVDKYRYLRVKESQREVQTSELMMLDRMFLAEEQQSLIRLRQESQEAPLIEITPPPSQPPLSTATDASQQEEYDEWACIQRELGCLPITEETKSPQPQEHQAPKRSASTDSRLETLKRFRVDKHQKKTGNEIVSGPQQTANLLNVPNIVSPSCAQDSQISPSMRAHALKNVQSAQYGGAQHVMRGLSPHNSNSVHGAVGSQQCVNAPSSQVQQNSQHSMLPPQSVMHGAQPQGIHGMQQHVVRASQQTLGMHHHLQQPNMPHISAITPHVSQHGVQNSQHGGAQNSQNQQGAQLSLQNSQLAMQSSQLAVQNSHFGMVQNSQQRAPQNSQQHCRQVAQQNSTGGSSQQQQRLHNAQQNISHHNMQHFSHSTQHIVQSTLHATQQHITHTVHHTQHIHHNTQHSSLHNATTQQHSVHQQNVNAHNVHSSYNVQTHNNAQQNNDGTDNIIDEQVQSAIDSILNLQQSSIDLEDAVNSILS